MSLFKELVPRALKPVYRAWMGLAMALGWVMTRAILSVIFYGVLTPIALILKMKKKDLLNTRFKSGESSYWTAHAERDKESYTKQF